MKTKIKLSRLRKLLLDDPVGELLWKENEYGYEKGYIAGWNDALKKLRKKLDGITK